MSKIKHVSELPLSQFTGTENYYHNALYPNMKYTDGVKYVMQQCESYWLLDIIGLSFYPVLLKKAGGFLSIKFVKTPNGVGGKFIIEDGNKNIVLTKRQGHTDFPDGEIEFWLAGDVLLLPIEY